MKLDVLQAAIAKLNPGGQTKLARMIGVNPRTVRRWRAGDTKPHPAFIALIQELLKGIL